MFSAIISDTKAWRNSIEAIAALIDEGALRINKEGMKLRAMDPSQIALVDFELPASGFEEFNVEEEVSIGLDFSELSKITKRSRADDKIKLSLNERLEMVFEGASRRKFSLGIIESSASPPREPSVEFTSEVKIGADALKESLKDAELVSNHVTLKINDGFVIKAEGDTGSVDINFPEDNILSKNVKEKAKAVFALDQLDNLLKAADASSVIILKLRADSPLRVEYSIGEGRVVYYLAPRIENV